MMNIPIKFIARLLLVALFPVVLSGCKLLEQLRSIVDDTTLQTETILNNAIEQISTESSNWQAIMESSIEELRAERATVVNDMEQLLTRGVAHVGLEVRCNIDFMRDMLVDGINQIRAKLKGDPIPLSKSVICTASPAVIDMNLDPNERNQIQFFGYNLDQGGVEVVHKKGSKNIRASQHWKSVSPYQAVLDLGQSGLLVDEQSKSITISLPGGAKSEIAVLQEVLEPCRNFTRFHTPGAITAIPKHRGGDLEFNANGPCVEAKVTLFKNGPGTELKARIYVKAFECEDFDTPKWDFTEGVYSEIKTLYTAKNDEIIREILSPKVATLEFIDRSTSLDKVADQGLVKEWLIRGDTNGEDIGKTYVKISFNRISLLLEKTNDCIPTK